jgi:hypothetical protein
VNEATKPPEAAAPADAEKLLKFLKRAQSGDASTLPRLQRLMREPGFADMCGCDLARLAELSLVGALAGENLVLKEGVLSKMASLRGELAGPDPSPVERLLVERVVACWLQSCAADVRCAQAKDLSFASGEYYQRRMDQAHRRFLQAVKTLELVRKMAVPVLRAELARPTIRLAACAPAEGTEG